MPPLRLLLLAFYFASAALLVMGHSLDDFQDLQTSDAPSISALDAVPVTVWTPPDKQFELQAPPADNSRLSGAAEEVDTYVRTAWGHACSNGHAIPRSLDGPRSRRDSVVVLISSSIGREARR